MKIVKLITVLIWTAVLCYSLIVSKTGGVIEPIILGSTALSCVVYSIRDYDGGI